jgi:hypothetical protein
MPGLKARQLTPLHKQVTLQDSDYAYIDSKGNRFLCIHDETHVRNSLAQFAKTPFENDADKQQAMKKICQVCSAYKITSTMCANLSAELTTKKRNDLNDSDFAYIDSEGNRKLPIHDSAHVSAALARFNQTDFDNAQDKASALKKVCAAAKSFNIQSDLCSNGACELPAKGHHLYNFIQLVDRALTAAEDDGVSYGDNGLPTQIELMRTGTWEYSFDEPVVLTVDVFNDMIANFYGKVRKGIALDCDHDQKAATGWLSSMETRLNADGTTSLMAGIDWTPLGAQLLKDKIYKFFSPEWWTIYVDPETAAEIPNVLTGGALTNRPLMKKLDPLVASENKGLTKASATPTIFIEKENLENKETRNRKAQDNMAQKKADDNIVENGPEMNEDNAQGTLDLDAATAKDPADRSPEEQALVDAHDTTVPEVDPAVAKTVDTDGDGEMEPTPDADNDPEENTADEKGKTTPMKEKKELKANEMVVDKAYMANIEKMANEGMKAAEELKAARIEKKIGGLIASESNKSGKFGPAVANELAGFYKTLSDEQVKSFDALVTKLPALNLFSEIGSSEDTTISGNSLGQIDKLAKELVASEKIDYSTATKRVLDSHPELASAHETEVKK